MTEENTKLGTGQKVLFYALIALLVLVIIFSFKSLENRNKEGFDKCIAWKCEVSESFCSKQREINNCCLGAGGVTAMQDGKLTCVFQ